MPVPWAGLAPCPLPPQPPEPVTSPAFPPLSCPFASRVVYQDGFYGAEIYVSAARRGGPASSPPGAVSDFSPCPLPPPRCPAIPAPLPLPHTPAPLPFSEPRRVRALHPWDRAQPRQGLPTAHEPPHASRRARRCVPHHTGVPEGATGARPERPGGRGPWADPWGGLPPPSWGRTHRSSGLKPHPPHRPGPTQHPFVPGRARSYCPPPFPAARVAPRVSRGLPVPLGLTGLVPGVLQPHTQPDMQWVPTCVCGTREGMSG